MEKNYKQIKKREIRQGKSSLVYQRMGSGDQVLLTFHGFGQTKEIFVPWMDTLGDQYTVYAFDLFYHGESDRPHSKLSKSAWQEFMDQFLLEEKIQRFEILGYSLGGRFAITTALSFADRVSKLTLIAPDGIYLTPWFKLATAPLLKSITKFIMIHPTLLDTILAFNDRAKIFNSYVADFIRKELGDTPNRRRVYMSWNNFKTLGYSRNALIKRFSQASFEKQLILGTKDQVLPAEKLIPLIKVMGDFQIKQLPMKHHQLIKPEVANLLLE